MKMMDGAEVKRNINETKKKRKDPELLEGMHITRHLSELSLQIFSC